MFMQSDQKVVEKCCSVGFMPMSSQIHFRKRPAPRCQFIRVYGITPFCSNINFFQVFVFFFYKEKYDVRTYFFYSETIYVIFIYQIKVSKILEGSFYRCLLVQRLVGRFVAFLHFFTSNKKKIK